MWLVYYHHYQANVQNDPKTDASKNWAYWKIQNVEKYINSLIALVLLVHELAELRQISDSYDSFDVKLTLSISGAQTNDFCFQQFSTSHTLFHFLLSFHLVSASFQYLFRNFRREKSRNIAHYFSLQIVTASLFGLDLALSTEQYILSPEKKSQNSTQSVTANNTERHAHKTTT